jgi:hypothetical protein
MIYNHIFDGVLPMKTPQEVWKGAQDHSHAFMQVLLNTCSLPSSQIYHNWDMLVLKFSLNSYF